MTLHLAVGLDGYGWHRQAWRIAPDAGSVLSGRYWADLARTAEAGLLDFVTVDDALTPQPGRRPQISPGRLVGRADAVLVAARMATATAHLGLIPVRTVTYTDPAHVADAIATLNRIATGRAGWQTRVTTSAHEAALFGRQPPPNPLELFDDAEDFVDQVRRRWGSPENPPVVAALAHAARIYQFAAAAADLVFVTPHDDEELRTIMAEVRGYGGRRPRIYADLVVTFGGDTDFGSDALIVTEDAEQVAERIVRWHELGADGIRLRPAVHARDLPIITEGVVPLLQHTGRFRTRYRSGETLATRLEIPTAVNTSAEQA